MPIKHLPMGLAVVLAGLIGSTPRLGLGQSYSYAPASPSCATLNPPPWVAPGSAAPWVAPHPAPEKTTPEKTTPEKTTPEKTTPEKTTPETPPITLPDTNADLSNAPSDSALSFNSPAAGIGSSDVAFNGTPGMIGDLFGVGNGQLGVPLIVGRSILHLASLNGMPAQGVNDFHLINESITPVGFQGGGGDSNRFFLVPPGYVFAQDANGNLIQPASVSGLQAFNLTQFGFPPGTDPSKFNFIATKTPDRETVKDQTSSDVFQNAPVYAITLGNDGKPLIVIPTANPSSGGVVVGRQKTAENTSPIPRDRVFMNYSYFQNTSLAPGGLNINRFSPGFEKTFLGGNGSVEVRVPFATTLNSSIVANGFTDTSHVELGNIYGALKGLLYQNQTSALSAGLAMTLPTGDDTKVSMANGTQLVRVRNQSVHLMPFVGGLITPTNRVFAQGFLQFDFDANGNQVDLNLYGNRLTKAGVANDATYFYGDVGIGYWLYRNQTRSSWLTGLAPTVELHYNRSLQGSDVIQQGFYQVGSFQNQVQNLNALVGGTAILGRSTTITAAYVTPIGNGSDQLFDGEARVSLNWFFGQAGVGLGRFTPLSLPIVGQ